MSRTKKLVLFASAAAGIIVGAITVFVRAKRDDQLFVQVDAADSAPDYIEGPAEQEA